MVIEDGVKKIYLRMLTELSKEGLVEKRSHKIFHVGNSAIVATAGTRFLNMCVLEVVKRMKDVPTSADEIAQMFKKALMKVKEEKRFRYAIQSGHQLSSMHIIGTTIEGKNLNLIIGVG